MRPPMSSLVYATEDEDSFNSRDLQTALAEHYRQLHSAQHSVHKQQHTRKTEIEPPQNHSLDSITTTFQHKYLNFKNPSTEYLLNHKIWYPKLRIEEILTKNYKKPGAFSTIREHADEGFINYMHVPNVIGAEPLPPLVHHTTSSLNGHLYVLGGIYNALDNEVVDLSDSYQVDCDLELPYPMDSNFIHNPAMLPNPHLFKISGETNHIAKPEITGDVPPPLLMMSSSPITSRYIFYYGGFQFEDQLEYDATGKLVIKRDIKLNNYGYILDTYTLKFRKFELVTHPTITSKHPITVPRFGHSSSAVNIGRKLFSCVATVFIMGGYKKNQANEFEIIGDLWKVEFSTTYHGKHDFIRFGETILATPIHRAIDDNFKPIPRAFHVAEIVDSTTTFGKVSSTLKNPNKVGILNRSYSPDSTSVKSFTSDPDLDLTLIVHGGTDGVGILGDVWFFDFDQEVWSNVDTYFRKNDEDFKYNGDLYQAQVKKVGHKSIIIDKYLLLIGGIIPDEGSIDKDEDDKLPDISTLYMQRKKESTDLFHRLFVLNLSTQDWIMARCFHSFIPSDGSQFGKSSMLGNFGSTLNSCNSRVVLIGGKLIENRSTSESRERVDLINNGIVVFEFPLGSSANGQILKVV